MGNWLYTFFNVTSLFSLISYFLKCISFKSHSKLVFETGTNCIHHSSVHLWRFISLLYTLCCPALIRFYLVTPADFEIQKTEGASLVFSAPPVCGCERSGPCWGRPSSSWMYPLFHSPPCCHPPGSAALPLQSWELKAAAQKERKRERGKNTIHM